MPPSGFRENHTLALSNFLSGCLDDLIKENVGVRTPREALLREIHHIDADLLATNRSVFATATLRQVKAFYVKVVYHIANGVQDLATAGVIANRELMEEVEAIHVADQDPPAKITDADNIGADRHREVW